MMRETLGCIKERKGVGFLQKTAKSFSCAGVN